jgi:hypothetical protein
MTCDDVTWTVLILVDVGGQLKIKIHTLFYEDNS